MFQNNVQCSQRVVFVCNLKASITEIKKNNIDEKWFVKSNQVYEQLRYEI